VIFMIGADNFFSFWPWGHPFVEARLSRGLEAGHFFPSILLRSCRALVCVRTSLLSAALGMNTGFIPLGTAVCLRRSQSWSLIGGRSTQPLTRLGPRCSQTTLSATSHDE
jgi:hypothetical protein